MKSGRNGAERFHSFRFLSSPRTVMQSGRTGLKEIYGEREKKKSDFMGMAFGSGGSGSAGIEV